MKRASFCAIALLAGGLVPTAVAQLPAFPPIALEQTYTLPKSSIDKLGLKGDRYTLRVREVDSQRPAPTSSSMPTSTPTPTPTSWTTRRLELVRTGLGDGKPERMELMIAAVSQTGRDVQVVDTYRYLQSSSTQVSPRFSLREVAYKSKAAFAINGGLSRSLQDPIPTGLLRGSGQQYSRLRPESTRLSGVFCVAANASISMLADFVKQGDGQCREALQSGPVVIEVRDGKTVNGITTEEPLRPDSPALPRSLVCLGHNGSVYFIRASSAHLFDLAEILLSITPSGVSAPGLCRVALNLGGEDSSGLAVRVAPDRYRFFGNADATIASVLIVP